MSSSTPSRINLPLTQPKENQHGKISLKGNHKPLRANKLIILKGQIISTTMQVTCLNPTTLGLATIIQVRGHTKISPIEIQVCKVKKVQVPIIKYKSDNHLIKTYFLP